MHLRLPLTLPRNHRQAQANRSMFHCKTRAHSFLRGTFLTQSIESLIQSLFRLDRKVSVPQRPSNESRCPSTLPAKRLQSIAACEENTDRHPRAIFLVPCRQSPSRLRAVLAPLRLERRHRMLRATAFLRCWLDSSRPARFRIPSRTSRSPLHVSVSRESERVRRLSPKLVCPKACRLPSLPSPALARQTQQSSRGAQILCSGLRCKLPENREHRSQSRPISHRKRLARNPVS